MGRPAVATPDGLYFRSGGDAAAEATHLSGRTHASTAENPAVRPGVHRRRPLTVAEGGVLLAWGEPRGTRNDDGAPRAGPAAATPSAIRNRSPRRAETRARRCGQPRPRRHGPTGRVCDAHHGLGERHIAQHRFPGSPASRGEESAASAIGDKRGVTPPSSPSWLHAPGTATGSSG